MLAYWLTDSSANSVRNLLANFFASVLRARNLLGCALGNPDLLAYGTIRCLAARCGAAARNVSSAACARIGNVMTTSSVLLGVRTTRDNFRSCFKMTATDRHCFHFSVRNADRAGDSSHLLLRNLTLDVSSNCLHCRFANRLADCVIDSSLLVFLDATTNV